MTTIYLIIDINIDKNNYLKKSLLSIFSKTIKENNKNNISKIQISDTNLFIEYSNNTILNNTILNNIKDLLYNTEKYIKNIYPEFGNDWNFSYKLTNNYLLEEINHHNICIIL